MLLAGVAGVSAWAAKPCGDDGVDIRVSIADIAKPGVLAMTVAGDSVALTESGSTPTIRPFTPPSSG